MPAETVWPKGATPATWLGFGAMCVGMFMAILDVQVVATSLPTIQNALSIEPDQMSWVQTAYLIAEVVAIPLTGLLTRVLSMRLLFVFAVLVFTAASIGCASSRNFGELIAWRVLQGFSGGTLIPAVFSAVFILFQPARQAIATTVAGVLAVLAPTVGPIVGGWITETYSWHWLFLVNVVPGIASATAAYFLLHRDAIRIAHLRRLDIVGLGTLAIALTALELMLKEGPVRGWASGLVLSLGALSVVAGFAFLKRTLASAAPVVDLRNFRDRNFAVGCILSFVLGIGLFGSVYLMPVFLAYVRGHDALEIGEVMLVTGIVQLVVAPAAVALETRVDARYLTAFGFALFAAGLALSGFQTIRTDFDGMFWPQVVRGAAIMFCLLPPTRLALGQLQPGAVPDASGLFNLMRNLGGAIGLALIDTVMFTRAPRIGAGMFERLTAGDLDTARSIGAPMDLFAARSPGPLPDDAMDLLDPLVQTAALSQSINEAWLLIAVLTCLALMCVPFAKPVR